jgi:hypothetical protein
MANIFFSRYIHPNYDCTPYHWELFFKWIMYVHAFT